MFETTVTFKQGKSTKNKVVYDEQETSAGIVIGSLYVSKAFFPTTPPATLEIVIRIPS